MRRADATQFGLYELNQVYFLTLIVNWLVVFLHLKLLFIFLQVLTVVALLFRFLYFIQHFVQFFVFISDAFSKYLHVLMELIFLFVLLFSFGYFNLLSCISTLLERINNLAINLLLLFN